MKKIFTLFIYFLFFAGVNCGYSQVKFTFTGKYRGIYHPLDSITVENLTTGSKLTKYYPDTTLNIIITGIEDQPDRTGFSLTQNYPNPFDGKTRFDIYMPDNDRLSIKICNIFGMIILNYEKDLPQGNHSFTFNGNDENLYFLKVKTRNYASGIKMLNTGRNSHSRPTLEYNGSIRQNNPVKKGTVEFSYNLGDDLKYSGFITNSAGEALSESISDNPWESKAYAFDVKKPNRIVILMYHEIVPGQPENEYQRNVTEFENDLKYLRDKNYRLLSMEDLLLIEKGDLELTTDGIIITFDDGYKSVYDLAYPLLSVYKMPATFFLVAEWIGTPTYMTWSDVWLLSENINADGKRLFTMGSHTSSHVFLEQSAQNYAIRQDYLNFLKNQISDSKDWIVDVTGQTNIFLSLPYGDGADNTDIIQTAVTAGYKGIRTSAWRSCRPGKLNLFSLPSIPILSDGQINIIESYLNY